MFVYWYVDGVRLRDGHLNFLLDFYGVGLFDFIGHWLLYGVGHRFFYHLRNDLMKEGFEN